MNDKREDIIALKGEHPGSWVYYYKNHTFTAHQRYVDQRIVPKGEFEPAPPGQYRCRSYRKWKCKTMVVKDENNECTIKTSNPRGIEHLHATSPFFIKKYQMYEKLRQEGVAKHDKTSQIVGMVKELPEFAQINDFISDSALNSIVAKSRTKADQKLNFTSLSNFYQSIKSCRYTKNIFLGKVSTKGQNNTAFFFGSQKSKENLQKSRKVHFTFQRNMTTEFKLNICIIHCIEELNCFPVMFILYQFDSYEIFKNIMDFLLDYAPGMKDIQLLTTELDDDIIKASRRFFQAAKIRCTFDYYIKEITNSWIDLELPYAEDDDIKEKLLRYSWALPLAVEHDNRPATFDAVINRLASLVNLDDYPNTVIFTERLKARWSSRIRSILPYSTYTQNNDLAEASERNMLIEFTSGKGGTTEVLKKIMKHVFNIGAPLNTKSLFKIHEKRRILSCGMKLRDNGPLDEFLENCFTTSAQQTIHMKLQLEKNHKYVATGDSRDLADPENSEPDQRITMRFKRNHSDGSGGRCKRRIRQEIIDQSINQVVEDSFLIDTSSPSSLSSAIVMQDEVAETAGSEITDDDNLFTNTLMERSSPPISFNPSSTITIPTTTTTTTTKTPTKTSKPPCYTSFDCQTHQEIVEQSINQVVEDSFLIDTSSPSSLSSVIVMQDEVAKTAGSEITDDDNLFTNTLMERSSPPISFNPSSTITIPTTTTTTTTTKTPTKTSKPPSYTSFDCQTHQEIVEQSINQVVEDSFLIDTSSPSSLSSVIVMQDEVAKTAGSKITDDDNLFTNTLMERSSPPISFYPSSTIVTSRTITSNIIFHDHDYFPIAGKVNPGNESRRKQKFVFRNAEIDESFESTK